MTKVEVVNRQVIDGKEYKRGEVITVTDGRARDLITDGKARPVALAPSDPPVAPEPADSGEPAADTRAEAKPKPASKEAKNG